MAVRTVYAREVPMGGTFRFCGGDNYKRVPINHERTWEVPRTEQMEAYDLIAGIREDTDHVLLVPEHGVVLLEYSETI